MKDMEEKEKLQKEIRADGKKYLFKKQLQSPLLSLHF